MSADLTITLTMHLPGQLPGLNEILEAAGHVYRGKKGGRTTEYSVRMKAPLAERIKMLALLLRLRPVGPSAYTFLLHELNQQRDPDNIAAGAQKIMLDALGTSGLMPAKDGWKGVLDLRQHWVVDPANVGVTVFAAARVLSKEEAVALAARACAQSPLVGAVFAPIRPNRRPRRRAAPALTGAEAAAITLGRRSGAGR